jgi:hypothetical protein
MLRLFSVSVGWNLGYYFHEPGKEIFVILVYRKKTALYDFTMKSSMEATFSEDKDDTIQSDWGLQNKKRRNEIMRKNFQTTDKVVRKRKRNFSSGKPKTNLAYKSKMIKTAKKVTFSK